MINEADLLNILIDEVLTMAAELECTAQNCVAGDGGARWKSQPLSFQDAVQVLNLHRQDIHQAGGHAAAGGAGGGRSRYEKLHRPTISAGTTLKDFKFFLEEWNRYKRASGDDDVVRTRDQLLNCTDEALRKHVSSTLGEKIRNITEDDLLKVIEELAVERQSSNLVHTVAMMSAAQERDEGIRQFVARLRGLAEVCNLKIETTCTCTAIVSVLAVDKWILMLLVKNLNDSDTRQEVMSKVTEMSLDETIAYVEAKETSKKAAHTLDGGGMASSQVSKVKTEQNDDQDKCKFCGRRGHGKSPNFDLKKASCPAFDNKCQNCMRKGHYKGFCTKKTPKDKPDCEKDSKDKSEGKSMILLRRLATMETSEKKREISKTYMKQMKMRQNMTKLGHEEWSAEHLMYVETDLPDEPEMKVWMCVDIKAYAKHKPPLLCYIMEEWKDSLVDNQQEAVVLTTTADTGAQVFVLGIDHL